MSEERAKKIVFVIGLVLVLYSGWNIISHLTHPGSDLDCTSLAALGNEACKDYTPKPGVFSLLIAVLLLVGGLGLFWRKNWARVLVIILMGIQLVPATFYFILFLLGGFQMAYIYVAGSFALVPWVAVNFIIFKLLLPLLVIGYFLREDAKKIFS